MADTVPRVLLHSEHTGGHVAVVELTGGGRPPLHHHDFDETFCVLEGRLTFQLGEDRITRRAGSEPPPEAAGPITEVIIVGPPLEDDQE